MQLDSIKFCVNVWSIIFCIVAFASLFFYCSLKSVTLKDENKVGLSLLFRVFKWSFSVMMIITTMHAFIPSTKTMCTVLTVPMIVNNETIQTDVHDIYTLGVEKLKETMYPEESNDD